MICIARHQRIAPPERLRLKALTALAVLCFTMLMPQSAGARSYELDSIAAWGKFPRFCVNVYRWGDRTFNTYDTTYVKSTGKRFNVKLKLDSWTDAYHFLITDIEGGPAYRINMASNPTTSLGLHLSFVGISVGYDLNISKFLGGTNEKRSKFNFELRCALFTAEAYFMANNIGTHINRLGYIGASNRANISFTGLDTRIWGVNAYYFFNNSQYSQSAGFAYGRIQEKSAGSWFAGISVNGQRYKFDFSELTNHDVPLMNNWQSTYRVENHDYCLRIGYAHSFVLKRGWVISLMGSPTLGLRVGDSNVDNIRYSFALSGNARIAAIRNYDKTWFYGVMARIDANLLTEDRYHTMIANNMALEGTVGFRFDFKRK